MGGNKLYVKIEADLNALKDKTLEEIIALANIEFAEAKNNFVREVAEILNK